ncbi:hypothetical protein EVA_22744, partial [gut metagenome]
LACENTEYTSDAGMGQFKTSVEIQS